jgi:hypothetical protein
LSAVVFRKTIEAAREGQTFQRFLIDGALIDATYEFKNILVSTSFLSFLDDAFYRCLTDAFESTKSKTNLSFFLAGIR